MPFIGACMKVHAELGSGFLEAVYQEAIEKEFSKRKIPFKRQQKLTIAYEGDILSKYYMADFFCFDKIILEIKVANYFSDSHYKQLQNYIKATKMKLGLLVNFGTSSLTYKRILNSSNSL